MLTSPAPSELRIDSLKITAYLLNPNGRGAAKARYFMSYGFDAARPQEFAASLLDHARTSPVETRSTTRYGTVVTVLGPLRGCPNGRSTSNVRSVWEIPIGSTIARLVTAYRH